MSLAKCVCVKDVEELGWAKLPKMVVEYYKGGADDEKTLERNQKALKNYLIRPLVLRDVSEINMEVIFKLVSSALKTSVTFRFPTPLGIAPTAFHRMAHLHGELATVQGNNIDSKCFYKD